MYFALQHFCLLFKTEKSATIVSESIYCAIFSIHMTDDTTHNMNLKYEDGTFLHNMWVSNEGSIQKVFRDQKNLY